MGKKKVNGVENMTLGKSEMNSEITFFVRTFVVGKL